MGLFTVKRFSLSGQESLSLGLLFAACATAPGALRATTADYAPAPFSKYQTILDRMPFGALPANFNQAPAEAPSQTEAQIQAEQQKLAQQINMSCINITPNGATAIGFSDLAAKPPVNFYLLVGANAGGWTVINADYDGEWAQIEKEGVTITLKLGKGLIDAPPVPPAEPPAPAAVAKAPPAADQPAEASADPALKTSLVRRQSLGGRPAVNTAALQRTRSETDQIRADIAALKESGGDIGSYMDRLRERKALEKADKDAVEKAAREKLQDLARKITEDELKKREREINLSLLEQGAKPVSDIELTPEEEQALIDKGVIAQ